jgi:hypothetical protein
MDAKLKIVLVLFVVVILAYAIYWVLADINKQKVNEKKDTKILETFEEYDIRKQILQQLDKLSIDSITKTKMFDSLSNKVDTYKNMSPEEVKDMIDTGIKELGKRFNSNKKTSKEEEAEEFEVDEELAKLDAIAKSFKTTTPTKETFAKNEEEDEPAPVKRQQKPYDADIASILDSTSSNLETIQRNLTKLKHILTNDEKPKPTAPKKSSPTIEGFENRVSNSYAYY